MGGGASKNRRAKNRVRLYWDVDNIELPNQNLDLVLQKLRQVHVTYLEWPVEEVVDFELKLVCNQYTNERISEDVKLTVWRAGFYLTVMINKKEATDREIERSMHKEIVDYLEHKHDESTKYNCFIGVLSNDEDFAAPLRRAKERGVSTAYVSSSPQLRARENVKGATTCIIDCADLGIYTSDASNDTTDIASPSRPPIVVSSYPSPPVLPYSSTSSDGPERGIQETPSAIPTDSSPEAEKIASDVPSLLDPPSPCDAAAAQR